MVETKRSRMENKAMAEMLAEKLERREISTGDIIAIAKEMIAFEMEKEAKRINQKVEV